MRFTIFEERSRSITLLIAADEERLIGASLSVFRIKLCNDGLSFGKNFGTFNGALSDRHFMVGAARVKRRMNLVIVVTPVERILHLVTIEKIVIISNSW